MPLPFIRRCGRASQNGWGDREAAETPQSAAKQNNLTGFRTVIQSRPLASVGGMEAADKTLDSGVQVR